MHQIQLLFLNYSIFYWLLIYKFGETAKAALKEINSLADFSIISLKHFQLLGITIPGQE